MSFAEIRPGQCKQAEEIGKQLKKDFQDTDARNHLLECSVCQDSLGSGPPPRKGKRIARRIERLANNLRDGIACAG